MQRLLLNGTRPTGRYTLSLHDALPICLVPDGAAEHEAVQLGVAHHVGAVVERDRREHARPFDQPPRLVRSEEHTSEPQSRLHLVCRLLREKKTARTVRKVTPIYCARFS